MREMEEIYMGGIQIIKIGRMEEIYIGEMGRI